MVAVLAACQSTPALTDPKQIITDGMSATADLKSFHISLAVDGTVTIPDSGGTFDLANTTFEGDVDVENENASLSFAVPALLSLSGELRLIGTDMYVKTSLTGPLWSHQANEPTASGSPAQDVQGMIEQVTEFLEKDGVVSEKLEDADCGERTCYHVRVTIPSELLAEEGATASMDPSTVFGDSLVLDLLFDREKLWLTEISTSVDSEEVGTLNATITFSSFDEAVTVTAPPEAEVTEGEAPLPGL
jgi:hypothetical protein